MYIIETEEGKTKSTAKGVPRYIKEKHLTFDDYYNALYNSVNYKHSIAGIRQESHKLYTQVGSKVTLSPFNDKKWISRDAGTWTYLSHGHYKIPSMMALNDDSNSDEMEIDEELVDMLASLIGR